MCNYYSVSQVDKMYHEFLKIFLKRFIYGHAGSRSLCRAFSSCSEQVLLSIVVPGLLVASLVVEH